MAKIRITDTTLRDAHQSLWATRMNTTDMLPILEQLDEVGYYSLEVWGGATFDVCIRFLNDDPWVRLKQIRERIKKTKLQMLLRGQSLLGYTHYPDDAVKRFVHKSAEYGIDIFRVFDALNDVRNLEASIRAVNETGKHAQACISYTVSPVHSTEHYVKVAMELKEMGADSICIKDMAGLLAPYVSFELVKSLREKVGLPVQLHTHYIGGMAVVSYLKAAEAGVNVLDTASVPLAFGSSQPPVETVVRALKDSPWDTGLNLRQLFEIADYFEQLRKSKGYERAVTRITDMKVFEHQVPGGMISNLVSQLEEQNASDRLPEVLQEIPAVRKDLGYPPLVTPTSQIIGIQAVLNVLTGQRYKMCPDEVKNYVRGLYGRPPSPIDPEIKQLIIGDEAVVDVRPADLLEPIWEKASQEMKEISTREEDILTYIMFPQVALKFFEYQKENGTEPINVTGPNFEFPKNAETATASKSDSKKTISGDEEMNVSDIKDLIELLDKTSVAELELEKSDYRINIRKQVAAALANYNYNNASSELVIKNSTLPAAPAAAETSVYDAQAKIGTEGDFIEVVSPMVGTFYAAPAPDAPPYVSLGDHVKKGQVLCIVEAMKLMNEVSTEISGTIVEIAVSNNDPLEFGQLIFRIKAD